MCVFAYLCSQTRCRRLKQKALYRPDSPCGRMECVCFAYWLVGSLQRLRRETLTVCSSLRRHTDGVLAKVVRLFEGWGHKVKQAGGLYTVMPCGIIVQGGSIMCDSSRFVGSTLPRAFEANNGHVARAYKTSKNRDVFQNAF